MKDKEFDQLFKDRLEDAELQPSANLWNSIERGLKPHRRPVFPGYWAAAAVIVMVSSLMLMLPDKEKIRLQGTVSAVNKEVPAVESPAAVIEDVKTGSEIEANTYESTPLVIAPRFHEALARKEFIAMQPKVDGTRQVNKKVDSISAVRKHNDLPAVVEQDLVIAKADVHDEINANVIKEVDYVASKADRRAYRISKSDADDDESSLVGINLGFIRLNLKRDK